MHSARRPAERFLIDGEALVCDDSGVANFEQLRSHKDDASAFLYGFDHLAVDGADMREQRLDDRRAKLANLSARPDSIRFSEHMAGGQRMFSHACQVGLEGIVSKQRDAPYRSGRSKTWLKTKNPESPAMRRLIEDDGWTPFPPHGWCTRRDSP